MKNPLQKGGLYLNKIYYVIGSNVFLFKNGPKTSLLYYLS